MNWKRDGLAKFYSFSPDLSILNHSLDWNKIKSSFIKEGHVVIDSFLDKESAFEIWQMYNQSPEDFWDIVLYDRANEEVSGGYFFNHLESKNELDEVSKKITSLYEEKKFSYFFHKSQNFHSFLKIFALAELKQKIAFVTGQEINELVTPMVTCYAKGHFCSPHFDHASAKVAMVYHLSKDWPIEDHGGVFIKDKLRMHPHFNSLLLFNVTGNNPIHEVTQVTTSEHKRISFTAWYS